jgi:hypothetical protein
MPSKSKSRTSSTITNTSSSLNSSRLSNDTSLSYGFMLAIIVFGLIVTIFILNWLIKVHKCKCANIEEGLYLKEWFIFLIIYQIILAFIFIINGSYNEPSGIIGFSSIIVSIIGFIMIVRLLIYINKLKEIKCDCGMSKEQNVIYYYFIIMYSIALFLILLAILGSIIMFMNK